MIEHIAGGITVHWPDGTQASYPYIWLRDNDPQDLHPDTQERLFDLTSVPLDIEPEQVTHTDSHLHLTWPDGRCSEFSLTWLRNHRPGHKRPDAAAVPVETWDANNKTVPARFVAAECLQSNTVLAAALTTLKRLGIIIIEQLELADDAGEAFGAVIGFKRRTNFGTTFEVINRPEPNNVAYTALALPLHTDLPNQELVPGYQFLHCIKNSAAGGDSVFVDGFRVCETLRNEDPEAYAVLRDTNIPFRFHDEQHDIRQHRALISEDRNGNLQRFVFNAHIADVPDLPYEQMVTYYRAYRKLMLLMRDPQFAVKVRLQPGQMVVFDNTRIPHGRTAFDPDSGARHLRGYYIEKNEVDSRLRLLEVNAPST